MCKWLAMGAALLLLAGCGLQGTEPARTPAPPTPAPPLSSIAASLTIPKTDIAIAINGQTRDHIADLKDEPVKCGIGRCHLTLLAQRNGAITVNGSGSTLNLYLPFTANAQIAAPGFLSVLRAKGDGEGEARTRTSLEVGPDWRLKTQTQGDVVLHSGHLRLGPFVTDIANLWNGNEEKLSRPLWRAMDRQLDKVDLRPQVAGAWEKLFVPIRVAKKPAAWLVLAPERLSVARPVLQGDAILVSLQLDVRGAVVAGEAPPRNPPKPLPAPGRLNAPSDRFSVAVPVLLSYGEASRLALAALAKRPPHVAGTSLRFSELAILPSGSDVVLRARFCADPGLAWLGWLKSCGTGYLRGTPHFDAGNGVIRVTGLKYDLTSAGLLLGTLRLLAGDALTGRLEDSLKFDEKKQIEKLNRQVTDALAHPQGSTLSIAADIQSFGAPAFTWTKDGFLASFSATGRTRTGWPL